MTSVCFSWFIQHRRKAKVDKDDLPQNLRIYVPSRRKVVSYQFNSFACLFCIVSYFIIKYYSNRQGRPNTKRPGTVSSMYSKSMCNMASGPQPEGPRGHNKKDPRAPFDFYGPSDWSSFGLIGPRTDRLSVLSALGLMTLMRIPIAGTAYDLNTESILIELHLFYFRLALEFKWAQSQLLDTQFYSFLRANQLEWSKCVLIWTFFFW